MTHRVFCDGTQTGVLITNAAGEQLLTEPYTSAEDRHTPLGVHPPACHVTLHTRLEEPHQASYRYAADMQTIETTGLRLNGDTVRRVIHDTAADPCGWPAHPDRAPGHRWQVFTARATGQLEPAPGVRAAWWAPREELQTLARRTISWSLGKLSDAEFNQEPGLRPVWLWWLHQLQMISVYERHAEHVLTIAERTGRP